MNASLILSNNFRKKLQVLVRTYSCRVNVIGAPISSGQPKKGTEKGPQSIRSTGFIEKLKEKGWSVTDSGDLDFPTLSTSSFNGVKNAEHVSTSCHKISDFVSCSVREYDRTIVLGGDHSLGIGSVSGHALSNPELCVIWIDAHPDIHTTHSSQSGNMHGMPLSFLIREMTGKKSTLPSSLFSWIKGSVSASSVAFIGIRDADEAENKFIQSLSISCFSSDDVMKLGGKEVISRVLDKINPGLKKPIHISFDIDSLDPKYASSTGTPVEKGIPLHDALEMGRVVCDSNMLSILDVVEVNPLIGDPEQVATTCNSAYQVIQSFIGELK